MEKKGDKKKKVVKIKKTEATVISNVTSLVSESPGQESEPQTEQEDTNLTTSSFSSQPDHQHIPDKQQQEKKDELLYDLPALSSVIVKRYEGETCKGRFHGEGVAHFQGGHVYKGMFSEGLMHGHGVYTWANGVKYEGEFVSNVPMGRGAYTWLDGCSYEGEVFNALRHGVGTHWCPSTSVVYKGQWHHGKRHGKGAIYYDQDMTSSYEGDWVNNNREGWGVSWYPSGNVYEGEWRDNLRHGEGRMRWLRWGQQYSGTWKNGVQHGQGTDTMFLEGVPGTQYPRRNEYRGDVVQGQRHGQGTFSYASGALYQGEWRNDEKHGQGKFIFKNGRIFEGAFVNDHMEEFPSFRLDGVQNLNGIRTRAPCPEDDVFHRRLSGPGNDSDMLGPDMTLDIGFLLEKLPRSQRDMEWQQVMFVVLEHISELRSIYSFYCSLGHAQSPDNTLVLTRLQFCRLMKDCKVHQHGTTLAQVDRLIRVDVQSEEPQSPFASILLCRFLSCVVAVAYHTYHQDMESPTHILAACFSKLMKDNILPHAKDVKGLLFNEPRLAVNHVAWCWEIYQASSRVNPPARSEDRPSMMTYRQLVWMLKDLGIFDATLTKLKLLEIITAENPGPSDLFYCNLDLEMSFLEFLEALLGCAEVRGQQAVGTGQEPEVKTGSPTEEATESPLQSTTGPVQSAAAPVESPVSPDVSSPKSPEMVKSSDALPSSPDDTETKQSGQATANSSFQTEKNGGDSAVQMPDTERREDESLQEDQPGPATERREDESLQEQQPGPATEREDEPLQEQPGPGPATERREDESLQEQPGPATERREEESLQEQPGPGAATERREEEPLQEQPGAATVSNQLAPEAELASNPSNTGPMEEGGAAKGVQDEEAGDTLESDLDLRIQRTHHFFSQLFFPACEHSQLLGREVEEERLPGGPETQQTAISSTIQGPELT